MKKSYKIIVNSLFSKQEEKTLYKKDNDLHIIFNENKTYDSYEEELNSIVGNSFFYKIKKRLSSSFLSFISIFILLTVILSMAVYEDFFKKVVFTSTFEIGYSDILPLFFVFIFILSLFLMPKLLDPEGNELKDSLASWFNKDIKKYKKILMAFSSIDKKTQINLYNVELKNKQHWLWKIFIKAIIKHFYNVNFHIRSDQIQNIKQKLQELSIKDISVEENLLENSFYFNEILLSKKEKELYELLKLCSSLHINEIQENFISLELFEYASKDFYENSNDDESYLGFQQFIDRVFNDYKILRQDSSSLISFNSQLECICNEQLKKSLAYYLRNHIESSVKTFENPLSLLILYYYTKDIVLDEKRIILILEKFIFSVKQKQQYELVNKYWFDIASYMFDSQKIENFEDTNSSIYRKLCIESLDNLLFLFERSGNFEQALLLNKYLYEINPNKYAINICSLYERQGEFDKALDSLPNTIENKSQTKPSDIQIRYYQRKAWIIVSQRKDELKQEGLNAIDKLKELLFSHTQDNEALWLWHYYNIKANYNEWDKEYQEAIFHYEKCLSIPSLGAFEYGATFVNMAIAYRFEFLTNHKQKQSIIDKSIEIGNLGKKLKDSVGDRDEMPVVLHNQALNILYKLLYFSINNDEALEVESLTATAIEILNETKSKKRLAIILLENIISKKLLDKTTLNEEASLLEAFELCQGNDKTLVINLYNDFKSIIGKIDFLE